jgi:hypothetical protein
VTPRFDGPVVEPALLATALAVIAQAIDGDTDVDQHDYRLECRAGAFVAVAQPRWWLSSFG